MRLSENDEKLISRSVEEPEFIQLLESILYGSPTTAMLEGLGNAFNLFPNDDRLLEIRLKQLIHDRYGAYLDWSPISEALWDAVGDFHDGLSEEEMDELAVWLQQR